MVCADAFVGPGVQIGEGAIIGARAVAVRRRPWSIVIGNPAREIKKREIYSMSAQSDGVVSVLVLLVTSETTHRAVSISRYSLHPLTRIILSWPCGCRILPVPDIFAAEPLLWALG